MAAITSRLMRLSILAASPRSSVNSSQMDADFLTRLKTYVLAHQKEQGNYNIHLISGPWKDIYDSDSDSDFAVVQTVWAIWYVKTSFLSQDDRLLSEDDS